MADIISRRTMIAGAGGAAAAAAVGIAGSDAVSDFASSLKGAPAKGGGNVALSSGGYADWLAQVGTNFTVSSGQVLRLSGVSAWPNNGPRPAGLRGQAFVARFDLRTGSKLADKIHRVAHPTGGTFDIFLTNSEKKGAKLLAVFN